MYEENETCEKVVVIVIIIIRLPRTYIKDKHTLGVCSQSPGISAPKTRETGPAAGLPGHPLAQQQPARRVLVLVQPRVHVY